MCAFGVFIFKYCFLFESVYVSLWCGVYFIN